MKDSVYQAYLRAHLLVEEGWYERVYLDSLGFATSGIGHLLSPREKAMQPIGSPVPHLRIYADFDLELCQCEIDFLDLFPAGRSFAMARQIALISMIFQMGRGGVARFRTMHAAIDLREWDQAADAALQSKWAREQTPARARRIAAMLRTGEAAWPE